MPVTPTPLTTATATTTNGGPPAHYSHQTLTAAGLTRRPISPRESVGLLASSSFVPPPPLQPFPYSRDPTHQSSPPLNGDSRRRTSSLTTNPLIPPSLQQHHRLPTTSAAPIASAVSNSTSSGGPLVGPSSSSHNNYPPGSQPSVMALPPGSAARIADGPSGSGSGGIPPPGTVLITSGGPSVAGHHPHQVQGSMHPAHDNGGHDKMNMLLGEIRSEYEVLQTDCMVLKGQRDEYENKSEWRAFSSGRQSPSKLQANASNRRLSQSTNRFRRSHSFDKACMNWKHNMRRSDQSKLKMRASCLVCPNRFLT
jgi:hypothetical protein